MILVIPYPLTGFVLGSPEQAPAHDIFPHLFVFVPRAKGNYHKESFARTDIFGKFHAPLGKANRGGIDYFVAYWSMFGLGALHHTHFTRK